MSAEFVQYAELVARLRDAQREAYAAKRQNANRAVVAELVTLAERLAVEVDAMTGAVLAAERPAAERKLGASVWDEQRARLRGVEGWADWRAWLSGAAARAAERARSRPAAAVVCARLAVAARRKNLAELEAIASKGGAFGELAAVAAAALRGERLIAMTGAAAWLDARTAEAAVAHENRVASFGRTPEGGS